MNKKDTLPGSFTLPLPEKILVRGHPAEHSGAISSTENRSNAAFLMPRKEARAVMPAFSRLIETRPPSAAFMLFGTPAQVITSTYKYTGHAWRIACSGEGIEVSILLGTVDRPLMVRECIEAVRRSVGDLTYEIVVAYGRDNDHSLPWLSQQRDVVLVFGGMEGAIPAFNRAYAASRGHFICQINDDVLVDVDAIAKAVQKLDDDPTSAAVVFKFDRADGGGLRHEHLGEGLLHPNQIVARRATCEAVIGMIGAFWGDADHRTDKTYGGDSAFGVICHHLGLRLDSVEGVTCRDLQNSTNDALRAANQVSPSHGDNWRRLYLPLLNTCAQVSDDRAARIRALDPVDGRFPVRARSAPKERVLHVHLGSADDPQRGIVLALQKLGAVGYAQVEWPSIPRQELAARIVDEAARLKPSFVFMQLQTADVVSVEMVDRIRAAVSDPRLVIATWCGDVALSNSPWNMAWQVPLGRAVDLTLHSSFTHVNALREAGVDRAGYLQIGYDEEQYRPTAADVIYDVSFLGNRYYDKGYLSSMRKHDADLRDAVIGALGEVFGDRFGLFGRGQSNHSIMPLNRAHEVYQRSKMGLNISLCNFFDCYSSDRIFRILGCGTALLTKAFSLMSVYGLRDGENCLVWNTVDEAVAIARDYARPERAGKLAEIAAAGAKLASDRHTWDARMFELVPYLAAVRREML